MTDKAGLAPRVILVVMMLAITKKRWAARAVRIGECERCLITHRDPETVIDKTGLAPRVILVHLHVHNFKSPVVLKTLSQTSRKQSNPLKTKSQG